MFVGYPNPFLPQIPCSCSQYKSPFVMLFWVGHLLAGVCADVLYVSCVPGFILVVALATFPKDRTPCGPGTVRSHLMWRLQTSQKITQDPVLVRNGEKLLQVASSREGLWPPLGGGSTVSYNIPSVKDTRKYGLHK